MSAAFSLADWVSPRATAAAIITVSPEAWVSHAYSRVVDITQTLLRELLHKYFAVDEVRSHKWDQSAVRAITEVKLT